MGLAVSEQITFERNGEQHILLVGGGGKETNYATAEDLVTVLEQNPDLRADVLAKVLPSEEKMAKTLYEADSASWDKALPWTHASAQTKGHYQALVIGLRMAMGVSE